jgi:hypothetical protein
MLQHAAIMKGILTYTALLTFLMGRSEAASADPVVDTTFILRSHVPDAKGGKCTLRLTGDLAAGEVSLSVIEEGYTEERPGFGAVLTVTPLVNVTRSVAADRARTLVRIERAAAAVGRNPDFSGTVVDVTTLWSSNGSIWTQGAPGAVHISALNDWQIAVDFAHEQCPELLSEGYSAF